MADRRTEKMKELIWELDDKQREFMEIACNPETDPELFQGTMEALEGRFLQTVDWYGPEESQRERGQFHEVAHASGDDRKRKRAGRGHVLCPLDKEVEEGGDYRESAGAISSL